MPALYLMLRLIPIILFPLISFGGYLAFDFWNVNRVAKYGDGDGVSFVEYAKGWVSFADIVSDASNPDATAPVPTELAAMLPKAPPGWRIRPVDKADADAFIPKGTEKELAEYVRAVVNERPGNGLQQVRQTYQNGGHVVVIELIRYPDLIFTSFGAMQIKMELQMTGTKYRSTPFMTVRGMEIAEDLLPGDIGLRYFIGDVSDQIWLRVLASKPVTDESLLPFFETLHVPAMAASVIEKQDGMGEVPVIVLASVIEDQTRAALEAERADQEARFAEARAEKDAALRAEEQAAASDEGGSFFGGLTGSLFGQDKGVEGMDREDREEALIAAAKSGDTAAVGALVNEEFGAIAKELGQTGANGGTAFATTGSGDSSSIKVGTGACADRAGGGKFCSISE